MRKTQFLSLVSPGGGGGAAAAGRQGSGAGGSSMVSAGQGRASPLRARRPAVMDANLPLLILFCSPGRLITGPAAEGPALGKARLGQHPPLDAGPALGAVTDRLRSRWRQSVFHLRRQQRIDGQMLRLDLGQEAGILDDARQPVLDIEP